MVSEAGDEGQGIFPEKEKRIIPAERIPHLQMSPLRAEDQGAQGKRENSCQLQEMRDRVCPEKLTGTKINFFDQAFGKISRSLFC